MKPRIYNQNMEFLGLLCNASKIGYSHKFNDIWHCSFLLPVDDEDNKLCCPHNIVNIFKNSSSLGKYRIIRQPEAIISSNGEYLKYECEHVICTLLDDVIDGYHEVGGTGYYTSQCINYLLGFQTTKRWVLDKCDYELQYQHKFENTLILTALFGMAECFDSDYHWEYNTDVYPFKLSLRRLSKDANCAIIKGINLDKISREVDSTNLVTRLYCKGYGEGINQLNIASVNNGNKYIDADTIDKYGIKASFFIDTKVENPNTLLALGKEALEKIKEPYISYKASAINLSEITNEDWYSFDEGKNVRIFDSILKQSIITRIVEYSQDDIYNNPLGCSIVIANKEKDVAKSIADLANRAAISATYSQGATNLYSQQFADNADTAHPAIMRVYIPNGCVRINQIILYYKLEKFRAYEIGLAAGGSNLTTTNAGGNSTRTSSASGNGTFTSEQKGITISGSTYDAIYGTKVGTKRTAVENSHSHGLYAHTHNLKANTVTHAHTVNIPAHSHSVSIPAHTHTVNVGDHTHPIQYGIYESTSASSVTVSVDGNNVNLDQNQTEIDLVGYLSTDSSGKIKRGAWHEIKIIPDSLSRIEANLFVQTFIQSIGGGDY